MWIVVIEIKNNTEYFHLFDQKGEEDQELYYWKGNYDDFKEQISINNISGVTLIIGGNGVLQTNKAQSVIKDGVVVQKYTYRKTEWFALIKSKIILDIQLKLFSLNITIHDLFLGDLVGLLYFEKEEQKTKKIIGYSEFTILSDASNITVRKINEGNENLKDLIGQAHHYCINKQNNLSINYSRSGWRILLINKLAEFTFWGIAKRKLLTIICVSLLVITIGLKVWNGFVSNDQNTKKELKISEQERIAFIRSKRNEINKVLSGFNLNRDLSVGNMLTNIFNEEKPKGMQVLSIHMFPPKNLNESKKDELIDDFDQKIIIAGVYHSYDELNNWSDHVRKFNFVKNITYDKLDDAHGFNHFVITINLNFN